METIIEPSDSIGGGHNHRFYSTMGNNEKEASFPIPTLKVWN